MMGMYEDFGVTPVYSPSKKRPPGSSPLATLGGLLGGTLEQLSRPGYAVTTPLYEFTRGQQDPMELLKKAGAGFMLDRPKGGYDILDDSDLPEWAKAVGGFGIDVATDPLNLVGTGLITKALKGTKYGSQALKGLGTASKAVKGSRPGRAIGRVFNKRYDTMLDFPKTFERYKRFEREAHGIRRGGAELAEELTKMVPDDTIANKLTNLLEAKPHSMILDNPAGSLKLSQLPPDQLAYIQKLAKEQGITQAELLARKQLKTPWKSAMTPGRMRHYSTVDKPIPGKEVSVGQFFRNPVETTKTAFENLMNPMKLDNPMLVGRGMNSPKALSKTGSLKARKYIDTIANVNQAKAKEMFGAKAQEMLDKGWKFFETDSRIIHAMDQTESKLAIAAHDFIKEIKKLPEFKGGMPKYVQELTDKVAKTYIMGEDAGIQEVVKAWDTMNNFWKGQALLSPAYHVRNVVGNLWNNYLSGVINPEVYAKAARIQRLQKYPDKLAKLSIRSGKQVLNGQDIVALARKENLLGSGWAGSDIEGSIQKVIEERIGYAKTPMGKVGRAVTHPLQSNRYAGTVLEDNARLGHFIDRLQKGDTPQKAAESVRKFLFDYEDLSDAEKMLFKRALPFYTWSRKNIPLQLEMLATQPNKFAQIEKGARNFGARDAEAQDMPDYLKRQSTMPLPGKGRKRAGIALENWLPAFDINKLAPDRAVQELVNMASPVGKTPIEMALNRNLATGKPLENVPGEKTPGLFGPVSKRWVNPIIGQSRVYRDARNARLEGLRGLGRWATGVNVESYEPSTVRRINKDVMPKVRAIQQQINKYRTSQKRAYSNEQKAQYEQAIREMQQKLREVMQGGSM